MSSNLKYQILSEDCAKIDLNFKIIIVGDSGVGKSCISIKASRNYFEDFYSPTIGLEFLSFNIRVEDKNIKLQIWDTCGQEIFRSLITSYFRNASLAIIVYSIERKESFDNIETWLNEIKTNSNPDIKIFLIGNKADLNEKREVSKESGENFYKDHKLSFFTETSAKTGLNVKNVFIEVAKVLYNQYKEINNSMYRKESVNSAHDTEENNNKLSIETGGGEGENRRRKQKGC